MRPARNDAGKAPRLGFSLIFFAFSLIGVDPLPAQERHPAVARISFVSGSVSYSRGDDPDQWDDAIENAPLTIGDRLYAPDDGQAELQLSSGNFVRLAPRSYLSTLNLSDDIKQFYLGEGTAAFHIRRLQSDEVIEIDTPNVSVTLEEPGQYRVAVDENGNSRITVRRGRVTVAASGRQIAAENSEIRVYGIDSPRYEIIGLPATDEFDRWVAERDGRFERAYADAYRHASDDIIGAEDLAEYGRWEEIPEYGYAWTPSRVAAGWAPFSDGRWYWQDTWGWTWISSNRWGWATSHYGRWTHHRSRWYWVPVRPRSRVRYAPACVEFVRVRDHVGWFPLHPRDRHIPWWERRGLRRDSQHITYFNRNYVTVVNHHNFISARPVHHHIVRDSVVLREARAARFSSGTLPIPNRSSLRLASEAGGPHRQSPSANILNRAAVVRTAPAAPPRTFQEKLPEIQRNQGRPIEPSSMLVTSYDHRAGAHRPRIRAAAEEIRGRDFAPRDPGAASGPVPQPVTAARGKKLATHETFERAERLNTPQQPAPSQPNQGVANRIASPTTEQERDRQRQEKQTTERKWQAQQQELDRKKQNQRNEEQRKAQLEKRRQDQRRQEFSPQEQPSREQQRLEELERRQAQQQREVERKAQLQQNRQEQERRQQLRQQQQLQEHQTQQRQQEQERKTQLQQQDRVQREQLRQQQSQQRQALEQLQREQERNAQVQEQLRAQQFRQRQLQEREAQQVQRQQQQNRGQQLRQQQLQERQLPQLPRQPAQPQRSGL